MGLGSLAVVAAGTSQAVTYTWDGGGSDNNWSSGANWNPDAAVPVSASNAVVQLNGVIRTAPHQDIGTPFLLNSLEFLNSGTAAFVLGGEQLQFVADGAVQPRIYLNRNATCTISNPIDIPSGTTLNMVIGTYGVNLNGAISGGGAIDKQLNAGGITFNNAANTFSGGLTVRAGSGDWYKVIVNASNAMGSGPVRLYGGTLITTAANPGGLIFGNTTTHTNSIALFQNSPIFAGAPSGSGNVTLSGGIDLNSFTLYLRGGGSGTLSGVIAEGGSSALAKLDGGTWTLAASNTFTGRLTVSAGTLEAGVERFLDPAVPLTLSGGVLNLKGWPLTVSELSDASAESGTQTLTGSAGGVLTVNQSSDTRFNGRLTGALGLIKRGAGSLTLSNILSSATGPVIVSNGTLIAASAFSLGGSTAITVAGGTLRLQNGAAIMDSAALRIESGAKLSIDATLTETVDGLYLNGTRQPRGTYGSTASTAIYKDDTYFEGSGMIYVTSGVPITPVAAIWDGGGSDTKISTTNNWETDTLPAFDGTTHARFGTGGAEAVIDIAADLYGMIFSRDANFKLAAGEGVITNGAGGITAHAPTTASRTYTIAEEMVLCDSQIWSVTNNTAGLTTLQIDGGISDVTLPCNIIKRDLGALVLTASNTFDGTLTVNQGDLRIYHSQALGTTNGSTTVKGGNRGRLILYGNLNIAEPLILDGEADNAGTLLVGSGDNVISAPVVCYNQVRLQAYNGLLEFTGGITADNNGLFVINAGPGVKFSGQPLHLGTRIFYSDSGGVTTLAVAGNTWSETMCAGGGIRCDLPDVLPPTAALRMGIGYRTDSTLNLNGSNQSVSKLYLGTTTPGTRRIISSTPATLTVNQNDSTAVDVIFSGAVSLLKLGTGNLTLTSALTATTGGFTVSNGVLTVSATGTLGAGCTNIVVGGSGTLALQNSDALSVDAVVTMPPAGIATAKIDIADGVNVVTGWLCYGSLIQRAATYGATGSGAKVIDDTHFSGSGILTVRLDNSGTLIMLR